MGKKDKKKKGIGKAKTEAREAKKADKARRMNIAEADDDDVEAVLAELLAKEAADAEVRIVVDASPPTPRAAFTMLASPVAESDLVFFGGERYNGDRATFFNDTYVYNVEKASWTRFDSATRPPPRSGHAVCAHRSFMLLFGGEFSNPSLSQYRHYRDLWRLDLEDMSWEKLDVRGGPTARSGHRMCVAHGKLIVFGGYFDSGFDNKYLNDMYYIDLTEDTFKWVRVETSAVDIVPSPRSGFHWAVCGDEVVLYGGYCREAASKSKSVSHKGTKKGGASAIEESLAARGIVHSDMYKLNGDTLKWQKVKRSGYGPSNRSGFSMVVHKRSLVTFGGVEDDETEEDLESVFYNDIFGFSLDRKKWHPMTIRKRKAKAGGRRRRKSGAGATAVSSGSDSRMECSADATPASTVSDPTPSNDGARGAADNEEEEEEEDEDDDDAEIDAAAMEAALKKEQEEESVPCGRFNACIAVQRNVLYISGGVVEHKDKDIALDDIWSVDLNKLDEFRLLKPLSEQLEWVESDSGDDDEDEDDDDDNDNEMDGSEGEADTGMESAEVEMSRKRHRRARLRERVAETEDAMMPRVFEALKDYHERTKAHWIGEVHEALGESGKGLRRVAFEWAFKRYWEMKPALKELEDLEEELIRDAKLEEEFSKAQVDQRRGRNRR
jgi:N-acetylneuraminic acid mutarotase